MRGRGRDLGGMLLVLAGSVFGGPAPAAAEDDDAAASVSGATHQPSCPPRRMAVGGGASAGWAYASHPGQGTSADEALLTNLMVTLSTVDPHGRVGFDGAVGETSTPSLQGPPQVNRELDIEYAAILLRSPAGVVLATGLLKPVSGFEDTYTYNNRNTVHGVVSSQQPYNAYGAALGYTGHGIEGHFGYYSARLATDEYAVEEHSAGRAWETDLGCQFPGGSCRVYHYGLQGRRSLTGAVVEYSGANVHLALNTDLCRWDRSMADHYQRRHALGAAFYVAPEWGRFSIPTRFEYVDQGGSRLYLDNPVSAVLSSATVTPTWRWTQVGYLRAEVSCVGAHRGFADSRARSRSKRVYLAAETGCLF